jgi:hypothetical protein
MLRSKELKLGIINNKVLANITKIQFPSNKRGDS